MLHLWHSLSPGPNTPDVVYAVVEVPKGSRNKYEYSKKAGVIKLDRVLYSPLHYPGDYGFIPQSLWGDGDPMDILVMMNEPTFPGCVIEARPVGMFKMIDKGEQDYKVLAVPATDPNFDDYRNLEDLPNHFPREVGHFFEVYKQLQGILTTSEGWVGADEAKKAIMESIDVYRKAFPPQGSSL
jgi:inorganic pyrophosphatase